MNPEDPVEPRGSFRPLGGGPEDEVEEVEDDFKGTIWSASSLGPVRGRPPAMDNRVGFNEGIAEDEEEEEDL